jgi:RNA polymerase sigma-70 factor (ECF subfamily)
MATPSRDASPAPADDEAAHVRGALAGDLDAFNRLVEMHQRRVYNLCLRMVGTPAAAEDACQDAFLAAYRNLRSFRGGQFRPWLMRIAANACTDELRRRARRPTASLDAPLPGSDEPIDVPDAAPGPEALVLRSEQAAVIQAALDMQGFAYDEIAATMRVSLGTVKSRIARGREKLRSLLSERNNWPR